MQPFEFYEVIVSGPSETTIRRLFAHSGNACAFPSCTSPIVDPSGTIIGEICHIRARSARGPRYDPDQTENERHSYSNLVLMCRNHHRIIDSDSIVYTVSALEQVKDIHERYSARSERDSDAGPARALLAADGYVDLSHNYGQVFLPGSNPVIAEKALLVRGGKNVKIQAPAGTIGADAQASSYILHLIKRYNHFAGSDKSRRTKFNYGAISRNIEARFHAPWRLLPMAQFDGVCSYLRTRINKTLIAKQNLANGVKSVSTFAEYIKKSSSSQNQL